MAALEASHTEEHKLGIMLLVDVVWGTHVVLQVLELWEAHWSSSPSAEEEFAALAAVLAVVVVLSEPAGVVLVVQQFLQQHCLYLRHCYSCGYLSSQIWVLALLL